MVVISDADLQRYGIRASSWEGILGAVPDVETFVILLASRDEEAERIRAALRPGRAHICRRTEELAPALKSILAAALTRP